MSRFSKPRKIFAPSTRKVGEQTLERQVLMSQMVRGGLTSTDKSKDWSWRDTYGNNEKVTYIPIDPVLLSFPFYVTLYEQQEFFVTGEDGKPTEYMVVDQNGQLESLIMDSDIVIGTEILHVFDENGNIEEFHTYDN